MLFFRVGELVFELCDEVLVFVDEFIFLLVDFFKGVLFFVEFFGLGLDFLL